MFKQIISLPLVLMSLLTLTSLLTATQAQTFNFTTVALEGEPAPDGNGSFWRFQEAVINDAGEVAFLANIDATSGGFFLNDRGIFLGDGVTPPTQIARAGQAAPDGNGSFSPNSFENYLVLNNAGQVAFWGALENTTGGRSDHLGIFRGDNLTGPTQITRQGQAGPNDTRFTDFFFNLLPAFNNAGEVAFLGELFDSSFNPLPLRRRYEGIFRSDATGLTTIAVEGQTAPGSVFGFSPPVINNVGQVAFKSIAIDSNSFGIFRGDGATGLTQIVVEGEGSPDGNGTFSALPSSLMMNDSNQVAFSATLNGTNNGNSDDSGIFLSDGVAETIQIAREGQAAPDGNGSFANFFFQNREPILNESGLVAFRGAVTGTSGGTSDDTGIFLADGVTEPIQIAREGQPAPDGNGNFTTFHSLPMLNNAGQISFLSRTTDNNIGIFFYDHLQGLISVVREGDAFLNSTVTDLFFFSSQENSGFNDLGQIAFRFELADGRSGIAIASPVPEPTSLLIGTMASMCLLYRVRHACKLH